MFILVGLRRWLLLNLRLVGKILEQLHRIAAAEPDGQGEHKNTDAAAADRKAARTPPVLYIVAFSLAAPTHSE